MPTKPKPPTRQTPTPRYFLMRRALKAIFTATRGDEKSQHWALRKFLDAHGIYNDDLNCSERLIAEACKVALNASRSKGKR